MEPHIGLFYIFTAVYVTYTDAVVPYQENWIDQDVDHFNFYSSVYGKTTYRQKYLVQGDKLYLSWSVCTRRQQQCQMCFFVTFSCHVCSGVSKGARFPWGSKFFQFHAVFGKIWQNRMLAPPGELAPPPRGNP